MAEPVDYRGSVEPSGPHFGSTETRQIGDHDPMATYQLREDPTRLRRESPYPVQKHDRGAVAALQHRGRGSCDIQSAVGNWQPFQESREVGRAVLRILGTTQPPHPAPVSLPARIIRS